MRYRYTFHSVADQICVNCQHFYQHYVYDSIHPGFAPIEFGHCAYPRLKNRRASDSCEAFVRRPDLPDPAIQEGQTD